MHFVEDPVTPQAHASPTANANPAASDGAPGPPIRLTAPLQPPLLRKRLLKTPLLDDTPTARVALTAYAAASPPTSTVLLAVVASLERADEALGR